MELKGKYFFRPGIDRLTRVSMPSISFLLKDSIPGAKPSKTAAVTG